MTFSALDIVVLLAIGGSAILGLVRGFVTEALALLAFVLIVIALRFLHSPLAEMLAGPVGTAQGAAVLSFAIIAGVVYFVGRLFANVAGAGARNSFLGPVDRVLGFGFGALKGLIVVSLGFLLLVLVVDTVRGGEAKRPDWIRASTTYPLLNWTSAEIAEFVDRRRKGEPVFGDRSAPVANAASEEIEIR